jgi:hypothetical protein
VREIVKLRLVSLASLLVLAACSHSLPPEPAIITVEVRPLPPTRVKGEMVEVIEPATKTWLSREEWDQIQLREAMEKAVREDPCQAGDPLCPHIR